MRSIFAGLDARGSDRRSCGPETPPAPRDHDRLPLLVFGLLALAVLACVVIDLIARS